MPSFGICGPSYTSQSPNFSDTQALNWYPESAEGNPADSKIAMYPTGGLKKFCDLVDTPTRGEITIVDRSFAVAGSRFYEMDAAGNKTQYGILLNDDNPVSMAGGTTQILIASGGAPYVFDFTANTFTTLPPNTLLGPVSFVGYCDGYFVALLANSNQFQLSALLDATMWDALQTAKVSVFTGNVLRMYIDHREIWFHGERQTQVYTNTGDLFPFTPVQGGFIEAGIYAPNSESQLDNTLLWIGGDDRGAAVGWRASGYTPTRITNHAVEFAWQSYIQQYGAAGVSTAVAYSFQDQGHAFWQIYFPLPNKTWVYDVATNMWHERGAWVESNSLFTAHHSWVHTFNFGKHLVGDWNSGIVYDMSIGYPDDNGSPIRRVRRAPSISKEQQRQFHSQLQIFLESGLGPQPPLTGPSSSTSHIYLSDQFGAIWTVTIADNGQLQSIAGGIGRAEILILNDHVTVGSWQVTVDGDPTSPTYKYLVTTPVNFGSSYPVDFPMATTPKFLQSGIYVASGQLQTNTVPTGARDPMLNLRWSDDSGHTWSNYYAGGAGQAGKYYKRVMFRRLGKSRNRIYEISTSDAIPWRISDAYLQVS